MLMKLIIATHGKMAEGLKDTLELIGGPKDNIYAMCFYVEGKSYSDEEIDQIFDEVSEDEHLIICTDIQYGSVNQIFMKRILKYSDKNITLLSGINLPLLLELISCQKEITQDVINEIVESASNQLTQVNCCLEKEEHDFF